MKQEWHERGQVLIMVTLALIPLLALIGLVTDIGWGYFRRQAAQAAADAAALGAARVAEINSGGSISCGSSKVTCSSSYTCPSTLPAPGGITSNLDNGCYYAKDNGFAVTGGGAQNVVMSSNTSGAPNGLNVAYWVTATVSEKLPQGFSQVFGHTILNVSAMATAAVLAGGGGDCVYIMDPTAISVTFSGSAGIHSSCGIGIKSNNANSVLWSGSPSITVTGGAGVDMAGGCLPNCGIISPSPTKVAQSSITDPLANLPTPAPSTPYQDASGPIVLSGSQSVNLNPGTYQYGITASGGTITMKPGLYIFLGGITTSGSTSISGTGVTIYTPSSGITMSGTGSINLTAPTSGDYAGIAFYEGRSDTRGATLSGGSNINVTGAFYAPDATLTFSGGSNVQALNIGLVVKDVVFSGNTYIQESANNGLGGGGGGIALVQ